MKTLEQKASILSFMVLHSFSSLHSLVVNLQEAVCPNILHKLYNVVIAITTTQLRERRDNANSNIKILRRSVILEWMICV